MNNMNVSGNNIKMSNFKKMMIIALIVALASQVNIGLIISDFRVAFGIILFPVFLFIFRKLNTIQTAILTALTVYVWRVGMYAIGEGIYSDVLSHYFPEIFFYTFYGVFFYVFTKKDTEIDLNKLFYKLILCDFFANFIEICIHGVKYGFNIDLEVISTLLLVALIRSGMVWISLNGLKYYRLLLFKSEHEERYKKLLWMTSRLKTEMYWMEKNMHYIEKTMGNAYELFEKISSGEDRESWADRSVNIAKDVHEIKKEYGLVVREVGEIIENKFQDQGMYFKDLIAILEQSVKKEIRHKDQSINVNFNIEYDFFTAKHYYLMSIFRNLIMNAIDALNTIDGVKKISFTQSIEEVDNGKVFVFKVCDTGSGIKKQDLDYIFLPGFSTKINYDTGYVNRGLGLSIVKDIVEKQLKGKILINSIENKGTTFEIRISKKVLEDDK
jgi:two-component system sensor histidine kinase YcbA